MESNVVLRIEQDRNWLVESLKMKLSEDQSDTMRDNERKERRDGTGRLYYVMWSPAILTTWCTILDGITFDGDGDDNDVINACWGNTGSGMCCIQTKTRTMTKMSEYTMEIYIGKMNEPKSMRTVWLTAYTKLMASHDYQQVLNWGTWSIKNGINELTKQVRTIKWGEMMM